MKIGVLQATTQSEKNSLLFDVVKNVAVSDEVINFGCFDHGKEDYTYVEMAIEAALLLNSRAIDFVVTGCSSGQGMMLACNCLPGIICGYVPTPQDAYLFGRINDGNAVSVPLGLNYGWAGEINLRYTIEALFSEAFGTGYPPNEATRKKSDTELLKHINKVSKVDLLTLLNALDKELIAKILNYNRVIEYIIENGTNEKLIDWIINKGREE